MPDTLTVYGQARGIVDVLANDLDPAGGLLVVQRAEADQPRPARRRDHRRALAAHLRDRQPDLSPDPQTVPYTISNGASSVIAGEVVVTQRPAPADNTPITVADQVLVRAGGRSRRRCWTTTCRRRVTA